MTSSYRDLRKPVEKSLEALAPVSGGEPAVSVGQQGQWSGKRAHHQAWKCEDKLESVNTSASEFHCI